MSVPQKLFRHCPRCGSAVAIGDASNRLECSQCGLVYYFNPAVAVAALIHNEAGEILFIRRAKDPARGKLAVPGGFVDFSETAETALRREVQEEVNLELDSIAYLDSFPNQYHYREVTYPVLDFYFTAAARGIEHVAALDGVSEFQWRQIRDVNPAEIAFPSLLHALESLKARL